MLLYYFSHCVQQSKDDLEDMISNISYFHDNCDFWVNHPTIKHDKIKSRHNVGPTDMSSFIFGAFASILNNSTIDEINSFDHFCLVSANQYFINTISFEKDINYIQFYNTTNWSGTYKGMHTPTKIEGFPLNQSYGRWDKKGLYIQLGIELPMASNWECAVLTKKSMLIAKQNLDIAQSIYQNCDIISLYPGYCALMSKQEWKFPPHFGTYEPSNPHPHPQNHIITIDQVKQKRSDGYFSIKRVNFNKNCQIKKFIRTEY